MNYLFSKMLDETCPKMNPVVLEGAAKEILEQVPEYIDKYIANTIKMIYNSSSLRYKGFARISAAEEYKQITKSSKLVTTTDVGTKSSSSQVYRYDISESDIYLTEFIFDYDKVTPKLKLYLPYADRGNVIRFSNALYNIIPVLSDTIISATTTQIFIRLLKDKLSFKVLEKNFVVDGRKIPGKIINGEIIKYNKTQVTDNIGKAVTPIALYILGKYGFYESLKRFANLTEKDVKVTTGELSEEERSRYVVLESSKQTPNKYKKAPRGAYVPHEFKILIKRGVVSPEENKDQISRSTFLENFFFGIIGAIDYLPTYGKDLDNLINKKKDVKGEIRCWRMLTGRLTLKDSFNTDRMIQDADSLFELLDDYIDIISKEHFANNDMRIETFYELIAMILERYNYWSLNSKEFSSDLNNRYIDINYYILYEILIGINKVFFKINRRSNKSRTTHEKGMLKAFSSELDSKKIFANIKPHDMSLCMGKTDYPGDSMFMKGTKSLEDQSRGAGVKRAKYKSFPAFMFALRGTDIYLGNVLNLPKRAPCCRLSMNPFLDYNIWTGKIHIPEDIRITTSKLDSILLGKDVVEGEELAVVEDLEEDYGENED